MSKVDDREHWLIEELKIKDQISLQDIMEQCHVSDSTARRMCINLEKKNLAIRTYGGLRSVPAVDQETGKLYSYDINETRYAEQKKKIGDYASGLVMEHDAIFLSGGTTVQALAIALAKRMECGELKDLNVMTCSISCAEVLGNLCNVSLTGGKVRLARRDVAGYISEQIVSKSHFNKCFVGVDGIDLNKGLMAFDMDTSNLDRIVLRQSDLQYILADSSKFEDSYFAAYEELDSQHNIITDSNLSTNISALAEKKKINIVSI